MPDNSIQRSYSGSPDLFPIGSHGYEMEKRYQRYTDPIHGFSVNAVGSGTEEDPYNEVMIIRSDGYYVHAIGVYIMLRYVMENKLEIRYLKIGNDTWLIEDNGHFHILSKAFPEDKEHYAKVISEVERLFSEG